MITSVPKVPTRLERIVDPVLDEYEVKLYVKRDDLIHPQISGNKWRKLKYNLDEAHLQGRDTLLTFGGAYSNHIYATAAAGKIFGFNTIGIIRGEEHLPLNDVLSFATSCGMRLRYLDRTSYRNKMDGGLLERLRDEFGDFYLVPEGGTNCLAVRGCSEIIQEISIQYDYLCCPVGTGGTLAGLVIGLKGQSHAIGFSALKGGSFLNDDVRRLIQECSGTSYENWIVDTDHHFGGFAKSRPVLLEFIERFYQQHGITLDPVYTGKMMFGVFDLVKTQTIPPRATVVALHTGRSNVSAGASSPSPLDSIADRQQTEPQ
jgi:1-aminocyclopropane-1-carboxylate deaminase